MPCEMLGFYNIAVQVAYVGIEIMFTHIHINIDMYICTYIQELYPSMVYLNDHSISIKSKEKHVSWI